MEALSLPVFTFSQLECQLLADRYYPDDPVVHEAARRESPAQFLRLFVTAHGMAPTGTWQTHTYARLTDSLTGLDHFFLIPMRAKNSRVDIRLEKGRLWVDEFKTAVRPQSIPYTTPFWYFHYDPNQEHRPYRSMTLNLKPACPEKCTLCGCENGTRE